MVRTINLTTDIPATREIHITLPSDFPAGPADIVLVVSTVADSNIATLGEFADSEFFGMWRDREDITNSLEFACDLRSLGWKRSA